MIRSPIPARAGTHIAAWRMHALVAQLDRASDHGSGGCRFESCQGHFGAVAQWQGVPSATGRSRVRTPPAPRHAACRRVEAQTAASRRPRARRRGRPARPRAGPISRGSWDRIPSPATRMWCSGSTPASQAGDRGFEPRHPLYPESQDNGSDPTMGLVTVLSMWTLPEKTWTNSLGMGTQRQGIRKHAIAPVAQRKSRCLLSTGSGYRNSVGARCLVHRHAKAHQSIIR